MSSTDWPAKTEFVYMHNALAMNYFNQPNEVKVTKQHNIHYIARGDVQDSEILATVHIPYEYLKEWYKKKDCCSASVDQISYIELLNSEIVDKSVIKIKEDCTRIEGRLRRVAYEVKAKYRVVKGGVAYQKLGRLTKQIAVCRDEVISFQQLEENITALKETNNNLEEDKELLTLKCQQLYGDLIQSHSQEEQAKRSLKIACVDIEKLWEENSALHEKIDKIGEQANFENNGRKISQVSTRQQYRKLRVLETRIEQALWLQSHLG